MARWYCVNCDATYTDEEVTSVSGEGVNEGHVQQEICPECDWVCDYKPE